MLCHVFFRLFILHLVFVKAVLEHNVLLTQTHHVEFESGIRLLVDFEVGIMFVVDQLALGNAFFWVIIAALVSFVDLQTGELMSVLLLLVVEKKWYLHVFLLCCIRDRDEIILAY